MITEYKKRLKKSHKYKTVKGIHWLPHIVALSKTKEILAFRLKFLSSKRKITLKHILAKNTWNSVNERHVVVV